MATFTIIERVFVKSPRGAEKTLGYLVVEKGRASFRSVEALLVDLSTDTHTFLTPGGAKVVVRLTTESNDNPNDNMENLPSREVQIVDR